MARRHYLSIGWRSTFAFNCTAKRPPRYGLRATIIWGMTLNSLGRYDVGPPHFCRAPLDAHRDVFGERHPNTAHELQQSGRFERETSLGKFIDEHRALQSGRVLPTKRPAFAPIGRGPSGRRRARCPLIPCLATAAVRARQNWPSPKRLWKTALGPRSARRDGQHPRSGFLTKDEGGRARRDLGERLGAIEPGILRLGDAARFRRPTERARSCSGLMAETRPTLGRSAPDLAVAPQPARGSAAAPRRSKLHCRPTRLGFGVGRCVRPRREPPRNIGGAFLGRSGPPALGERLPGTGADRKWTKGDEDICRESSVRAVVAGAAGCRTRRPGEAGLRPAASPPSKSTLPASKHLYVVPVNADGRRPHRSPHR